MLVCAAGLRSAFRISLFRATMPISFRRNQVALQNEELAKRGEVDGTPVATETMLHCPTAAFGTQRAFPPEGSVSGTNTWLINELVGDVYIADGFGKSIEGTLIGSNLGNAVAAHAVRIELCR